MPSNNSIEGATYSSQTYLNSSSRTTNLSDDASRKKSDTGLNQYVLPVACTLIFSEEEQNYQPETMLLNSGAQRSFIKTKVTDTLNLPIICPTSDTTTGIGELQENFNSNEVVITLKGLHIEEAPASVNPRKRKTDRNDENGPVIKGGQTIHHRTKAYTRAKGT
ncbi:hypothetical protein ANCDUO_14350 [Ancylostoma duodenale]|uniref:Peptidase aspartic putative domain-containing protein n=1 Tax=Ancylostoma duodenale TaxID=51022 RepID=A0A0C2D0C9_9BILA|nr:hypothetical protein ANCDUO_14350 [Ancylostoma duodenale]